MDIQIEYDLKTKEIERKETVRIIKNQYKKEEKRLEKIISNTNDITTAFNLINLKFNIALEEICDGNKDNGINKLDEIQELSELLDKKENLENLLWIDYSEKLIRLIIPALEKNFNDSKNLISEISDLTTSFHQNNQGKEKLFDPLPILLSVINTKVNQGEIDQALEMITEAYWFWKDIQVFNNKVDVNLFLSILNKLRKNLLGSDSIETSEQLLEEFLNYFISIGASPGEYLNQVPYLKEAIIIESQGNHTEAIKSILKAIEQFLLYPNAENIPEITDEIGKAYLIISSLSKNNSIPKTIEYANKALTYLTKHNVNKKNLDHLKDLLNTNMFLSDIYIDRKEYQKAIEIVRRTRKIFKNSFNIIPDEELYKMYYDLLDQYLYILLEYEEFDEQEEVFQDLIELISPEYKNFKVLLNIVEFLDSVMIHIKIINATQGGNWYLKDYIEEIFKKYTQLNLISKDKNPSPELKNYYLNVYIDYIDVLLGSDRIVPIKIINKAIQLCQELLIELPEEVEQLSDRLNYLEEIRSYQKSVNSVLNKKKKTYGKKRKAKLFHKNRKKKK